jgi:hypothetical protein
MLELEEFKGAESFISSPPFSAAAAALSFIESALSPDLASSSLVVSSGF